jgi:hypothetical protein
MMEWWAVIARLNLERIATTDGSTQSANFSSLTSIPILSTSSLLSLSWLTKEGRDSVRQIDLAEAMARLSRAFLLTEFVLSRKLALAVCDGEAGLVCGS